MKIYVVTTRWTESDYHTNSTRRFFNTESEVQRHVAACEGSVLSAVLSTKEDIIRYLNTYTY